MAVPQLQLANLGEIFAQNQAKQAEMDTMQLQQAEAVSARDARVKAAEREEKLREAIASGVDPSTPEGLGQLASLMSTKDYFKALDTQGQIKLANIKGQTAQQTADAATVRAKASQRRVDAQVNRYRAQNRIDQARLDLDRQNTEREYGAELTETFINASVNILSLPLKEQEDAYNAVKPLIEAKTGEKLPEWKNGGQNAVKGFAAMRKPQKQDTGSGEGSFKEYQYKAAQYGQRMNSSSNNMKAFENPSVLEKAFQKSGMFGNFAQTPERQMYYQAQREFINAIKRQESGAAVTDSEVEDYAQTYFPQPGDTPEVIQRKRESRERAVAGLKATAGGAWDQLGKAVSAVTESQPAPTNGGQGGVISFEEFMSQ